MTDSVVLVSRSTNGTAVLHAGVIIGITDDGLRPVIAAMGEISDSLLFHPALTIEEIESIPVGSWTWPFFMGWR